MLIKNNSFKLDLLIMNILEKSKSYLNNLFNIVSLYKNITDKLYNLNIG